jgi:hypothetical protein
MTARADVVHELRGVFRELRGAVVLCRFEDVDQVMRHALALFTRGLGGADVHAAINIRAVHADDLYRLAFNATRSNAHRSGRFSAACGTY